LRLFRSPPCCHGECDSGECGVGVHS
ncbi:hypothetical protein CLOP_g21731, partial [Closterium sp. NIES-67]